MLNYKVSWFNYFNKNNKPNLVTSDYYNDVCSKSDYNILVAKDDPKAKKMFSVFPNPLFLYEYQLSLKPSDRNMYEIIPGNKPQKVHFDIDIHKEDESFFNEQELFDDIIDGLKKYTKLDLKLEKDIMIFTSHGKDKKSYHIILDNYFLRNYHETKQLIKLILCDFSKLNRFVDTKIYTSNRQFRLFGSCKLETSRFKVLLSEWKYKNKKVTYHCNDEVKIFLNSLVTNVNDSIFLDIFEETQKVIPKQEDTNNWIKDGYDVLSDITEMYTKTFGPDVPFSFGCYDSGLITTRRIKPSFCDICNRIHEHENPYFLVKSNGDVCYSCRRTDSHVKIGNIKLEADLESLETISAIDNTNVVSDDPIDSLNELIRNQMIIDQHDKIKKKEKTKDFYRDRSRLLSEMFSL